MLYSFEDFVLDTDKQELRRGNTSVHLEPQMYNLLELLIRSRDRVVSKDELLEAVWKGRHVSESTLTSRINLLRKAIGDAGGAKRLIKTVQKSGYRFVGQVSQAHGAASDRSLTRVNARQVSKVDAHQDNNREDNEGVEASTPVKRRLPIARRLPPQPALLLGREKDLLEINTRIAATQKPSERRITVVRGWPGVGKTSLVNMLAHDKEVMEAFPDGVLWAAFGASPNLLGELTSWSHALGTPISESHTEIADLTFRVRNLLHDRQVLLILDDVWEIQDFLPFKVAGPRCATLVTTRVTELARDIATTPSDVYWLNKFDETSGLELLGHVAPSFMKSHLAAARRLVSDLDGLPLALRVAGRLLESEMALPWDGIRELLTELSETNRLLSERPPEDRYDESTGTTPTVSLLLRRSTDRLDPETRRRFSSLGSFAAKPATFDLDAMHHQFRSSSIKQSRDTVRKLVDRGLLEPSQSRARFQMHALLMMHARSLADPHLLEGLSKE